MRRVLAPALCLLAALGMVLPVAVRGGWPYSHEYSAPFERVEAFRRAFVAFDLVPTWTPFAFNGHGTPSPLIYHRLFNWVGGLLAVPLGTELGTRVALIAFAWFGAWGLYRVARRLDIGPARALLVAVAFLWAPYSLTDWLVRGSFAEFASMMVLPWLLEALVRQLQGERVWVSLGLSLAALMHAHQSLGLFLAPLPVLSTAMALLAPARGARGRVLLDALKAAGLGLALTLPWLVPVLRVGGAFRLDTLKIYVPWGQYVAWSRYLVDDDFPWGHTFQGFSVELSRALLVATGLGLGAAVVSGARTRRPRELLFLAAVLFGASLLQSNVATPLYQSVPNAALLQFPWRMLSLMTPVACLIFGLVLEAVAQRGRLWALVATGLALAVAGQHALRTRAAQAVNYAAFTPEAMQKVLVDLDGPTSAGEYLPRTTPNAPERTPWVQAPGCTLKRVTPPAPAHFTRLEVELEPGPACRVVFSQFVSPLLALEGDGRAVDAGPFVTVDVPAGGTHVVLRRRNLLELWWP